jgi:hypothetical protein
MKVKMQLIPIVILLLSSIAFGADKGKEQVFPFPQQAVWQACIKAASQEFTLDYSDKESGILSFSTGISLTSNGFKNSVALKELPSGGVKVTLNTQKKGQVFAWGAGGRIAEKYFKAVEKILQEDLR